MYVINLIPLHVLSLLLMGRYSHRLYVAYSTLYVLGTLLAMQIPFVGFQHVQSNEHMLAMITFTILQIFVLFSYLQQSLGEVAYTKVSRTLIPVVIGVGIALFLLGQQSGMKLFYLLNYLLNYSIYCIYCYSYLALILYIERSDLKENL